MMLYVSDNLLEGIEKLIMTFEDKIRDVKLQYDINREVEKIMTLSSRKIDEQEYLRDEKISSDQSRMVEQAGLN